MVKYRVHLSEAERQELKQVVSQGQSPARMIRRAQILLKSDAGETDEAISEAVMVSSQTVYTVRKQCVQEGMNASLHRTPGRKAGQVPKSLDGVAEAHLVALTCGEPPEGYERWSMRLLANRMVVLEHVEAVSHETVRVALKKMNLSRGASRCGASRPSTMPRS